ncbi:hypothetical protein GCM10009641_83660 [Mycobacterium cookii]|uniref:Uncharacterized protein n=1 Tax=Mycobacterium cookii TaxID=1775 RepID=A0A7I7KRM7_9MYCO|nr:hypothetical protein [Mycobacterium cookii]MCV7331779.1 hypothetical protein [Mycobacterium cookii]BBX44376.1 hypothetical protein MCOO_03910 [Mycobacterium cookii]
MSSLDDPGQPDERREERQDFLRVQEQVGQFLRKLEKRQDHWRSGQVADALPNVIEDFSDALNESGHSQEATTTHHLTQVGTSHHEYSHDQISGSAAFPNDPLTGVIMLFTVVKNLNDTFDVLQKINDSIESPYVEKMVEEIGASLAGVWDQFKEGTEKIIEDVKERMTELASPEQAQEPIKTDAELAANAIEKATDEINQEMTLQDAFAPAAEAKLKQNFAEDRQKLESKLDKNEEKYFEKHPDLSPEEKDAAEKKFDKIRDDAVQKLEDQQAKTLAEREARQQAELEDLEQKRRELEDTRAER